MIARLGLQPTDDMRILMCMRLKRRTAAEKRTGRTKRAQVLMDPREYVRLEAIAKQQKTSVGELMRSAVREKYLGLSADAQRAARDLCAMNIPIDDWAAVERDIAEAHGGDIDIP